MFTWKFEFGIKRKGKHNPPIDEITFCADTGDDAYALFKDWFKTEYPKKRYELWNIQKVYNKADHEYYGELYEWPKDEAEENTEDE